MSTSRVHVTYDEYLGDPSLNPFGVDAGRGYDNVYQGTWRTTNSPPEIAAIHDNVMADFQDGPTGVVAVYLADDDSPTGILKTLLGFQQYPGRPGEMNDERRRSFAYCGEVDGIDIDTIAVNVDLFERTRTLNIPDTAARMMELLEQNPDDDQ